MNMKHILLYILSFVQIQRNHSSWLELHQNTRSYTDDLEERKNRVKFDAKILRHFNLNRNYFEIEKTSEEQS